MLSRASPRQSLCAPHVQGPHQAHWSLNDAALHPGCQLWSWKTLFSLLGFGSTLGQSFLAVVSLGIGNVQLALVLDKGSQLSICLQSQRRVEILSSIGTVESLRNLEIELSHFCIMRLSWECYGLNLKHYSEPHVVNTYSPAGGDFRRLWNQQELGPG